MNIFSFSSRRRMLRIQLIRLVDVPSIRWLPPRPGQIKEVQLLHDPTLGSHWRRGRHDQASLATRRRRLGARRKLGCASFSTSVRRKNSANYTPTAAASQVETEKKPPAPGAYVRDAMRNQPDISGTLPRASIGAMRSELIDRAEMLAMTEESPAGLATGMESGHYPRPLRCSWRKNAAGRWQYSPVWRRGAVQTLLTAMLALAEVLYFEF